MGGGALQGVVDALVMILRITFDGGSPRDFVAEDHFAIDHGGALAVAGAEIEADPAAIQMAAERSGGLALGGAGVVGDTLERHRAAVDAVGDELVIEGARARRGVDRAEILAIGDGRQR